MSNCRPWGLYQFTLPLAISENACFPAALSLEYAVEFLDFCPSLRWKLYLRVVLICIFLMSGFEFLLICIFISLYCCFFYCPFSIELVFLYFIISPLLIWGVTTVVPSLTFIFWFCSQWGFFLACCFLFLFNQINQTLLLWL